MSVIYLIGHLPLSILYIKSHFLSFILNHIICYRKKVIYTNLQNSFPEKNKKQIKNIANKYYLHLSDLIFETIKSFYISAEQLNKRYSYKNKFEEYAQHQTSFIFMLSHTGNWEWANLFMSLHSPIKVVVVYKKISNEYLNRFMLKKRSRFGSVMVEMNDIAKYMLSHKNEKSFYVFLSDQTPLPKNAHWDFFLNQETPFLKGAAFLAKKMQFPVIYGNTFKISRGVYQTSTKNISDIPNTIDEKEILHTFIKNLESDICNQPEFWLWSHKRWKHKKTDL